MKVTRPLLVAISMYIIFSGIAVAAENPHEQIIIVGVRPAVFDRDTHLGYGVKCGISHHQSKNEPYTDQEVISPSNGKTLHCVYCHNENFKTGRLRKLKVVMHKHCKNCHQKGVDGAKGLTRCHGCHNKKEE